MNDTYEMNERTRIDLDEIIAKKFPGKKIPRFIINWAKKIIHQDFLNENLDTDAEGLDFCDELIRNFDVTIDVDGLENIPSDGTRYTFASNHPLGGVDGIFLASVIGRKFGSIVVPVNDFLLYIKPLAPLFIPVNKVGSQARNHLEQIDAAYRSDKQMLMFPAGSCSRKIDGRIQDKPWSKSFIKKSIETGRPVVPVHFIGQNSRHFYRMDSLSKLIGTNIAMAFLPDELYRAQGKQFKVVFGEPIPVGQFDKSKSAVQWAAWVREKVYSL